MLEIMVWLFNKPWKNSRTTIFKNNVKFMRDYLPGLILNLSILGCLLEMNLMGWSVDCLCRSLAEINCNDG